MSYREKLIWTQFALAVGLFGYLCLWWMESKSGGTTLRLTRGVLFFACLEVFSLIIVPLLARREPRDERDQTFEYTGYKVGYLLVVWGGIVWASLSFKGEEPTAASHTVALGLLALILGAEVVRWITLLVLYRTASRT